MQQKQLSAVLQDEVNRAAKLSIDTLIGFFAHTELLIKYLIYSFYKKKLCIADIP